MSFAEEILSYKYAHTKPDGSKENWAEVAKRVAWSVMGQYEKPSVIREVEEIIYQKKFMPGGRYLYASGRPNHQITNCMLLDVEDSREGWAELMQKAVSSLMVGAGIGVVYSKLRPRGAPVKGLGGTSTGPLALMNMVNEAGRNIMQGGSRRSAIWAGLHWNHPDVFDFIRLKDWPVEIRKMKEDDFNFPAQMDHTNISVILDDLFFSAYEDENHPLHSLAQDVYKTALARMAKTGEPGFSVNVNNNEVLRNAPLAGDTYILTKDGYKTIEETLGQEVEVWTGIRWAKTEFKKTGIPDKIINVKISGMRSIKADPEHEFFVVFNRKVKKVKAKDLQVGMDLLSLLPETPEPEPFDPYSYTVGYVLGDGTFSDAGGWLVIYDYDVLEPMIEPSRVKENYRGYIKVFFAGLKKAYTNLYSFIAGLYDSNGTYDGYNVKLYGDFEFLSYMRRLLESLGIMSRISLSNRDKHCLRIEADCIEAFMRLIPTKRLKVELREARRKVNLKVVGLEVLPNDKPVYCCDVKYPEHSFMAEGIIVSNCTEVTSADDSDSCNLGSINLARIDSLQELDRVVELAMIFMLCGTMYGLVPYEKVAQVREKNRRLGLGLMGLHEWLLLRGYSYDPNPELAEWLEHYSRSGHYANMHADRYGISRPIKTRAVAPAGTISIIAETTSGIEPIFCVAMKRRFLTGSQWNEKYVIDAAAQRLIDKGLNPDKIEDAYIIGPERKIAMQAFVQQYVDQAISSTVNLDRWGSPTNNQDTLVDLDKILAKYLKRLRGITFYPDGARGGQPIVPVPYYYAKAKLNEIDEHSNKQSCVNGVCGI